MITVCPSILSADFSHLAEEIKDVEEKGAGCLPVSYTHLRAHET